MRPCAVLKILPLPLLFVLLFWPLFAAGLKNELAMIVDKQAITSYDITATMRQFKVKRPEAIELLINEKIAQAQLGLFGIFISDSELDGTIASMLKQNEMSQAKLRAELAAKGQSMGDFRAQFKKDMEQKKLYEAVLGLGKFDFSDEGARGYFEQHSEDFGLYTRIDAIIYSSDDEAAMTSFEKTGKAGPKIRKEKASLTTQNTDPRLLALLSRIPDGGRSVPLRTHSTTDIYEIVAKTGLTKPGFNEIKDNIIQAYLAKQRQDYLRDYFLKLRANADVKILRE